jgi:hypothetical protein
MFIGLSAGVANTTGTGNMFIGHQAGVANTEGTGNTFIGNQAGSGNTTGRFNTFIGNQAGSGITTGISNTFIGNNAGASSNITGSICIGDGVIGNTSNELTIASNITQIRMTGLASQAVGSTLTFDTANKTIMYTASSERYKKDIMDIENVYSIDDIVDNLRPVSFKWKTDGVQDFGLIAEEVELVLKDLVCYNSDGIPETVAYYKLSTVLLAKIKKQTSEIAYLKSELLSNIQLQESENAYLKSELLSLKTSVKQLSK